MSHRESLLATISCDVLRSIHNRHSIAFAAKYLRNQNDKVHYLGLYFAQDPRMGRYWLRRTCRSKPLVVDKESPKSNSVIIDMFDVRRLVKRKQRKC